MQALGINTNLLLLNKVQTTKTANGYELTVSPRGSGSILQSMGISRARLKVSNDFRIMDIVLNCANGAQIRTRFSHKKMTGGWFPVGYSSRTSLPNGGSILETASGSYATVSGVPLTARIDMVSQVFASDGQNVGTANQRFTFRDWRMASRDSPLQLPRAEGKTVVKRDRSTTKTTTRKKPRPSREATRRRVQVPRMEKYVSAKAHFALYKPKGWLVQEATRQGYLLIGVTDPSRKHEVRLLYGINPFGNSLLAIIRAVCGEVRSRSPDLRFGKSMLSADKKRIVFDVFYTDRARGKREGRCWVSYDKDHFIFTTCEAPAGQFQQHKKLFLGILANIRIFKNTIPKRHRPLALTGRRLSDGSASLSMPQGWSFQDFGTGCFLAKDPRSPASFIVANVMCLTPQARVRVPGTATLPYLRPHRALPTLAAQQGLATDIKCVEVIPRPKLANQILQIYTAGPVAVEEFVYTFTSKGVGCEGYTFGISYGSHLGYNWRFSHISVSAPGSKFDAYAPTYVAMVQSYKINDAFVARYIAAGTARLRQMQQDTLRIMAKTRHEIHSMMQAAYDERQRSQDYIDYLRTSYIRGESDWISNMEGGTVYHTDSWGTRNTITGQYWEGKPYDYVHFEGRNPRYNEQMTQINSRRLWEQVFGK